MKKRKKRKFKSDNVIPMSIPTGEKTAMVDVHAVEDRRGIKINRVGVTSVKFPMMVRMKSGGKMKVMADIKMYGDLLKNLKGTNMSRFIEELLANWKTEAITGDNFKYLLKSLQAKLGSDDVYISAGFDFHVPKVTPVTKRKHLTSHRCRFIGQIKKGVYFFTVETDVLVASYCPCSKEMCLVDKERDIGRGAHAQRGLITTQVRTSPSQPGLWLEDIIRLSETSGSAELYPLLKRPDEKWVTEVGYANPKYVEDIARDVMVKLKKHPKVRWARVRVRNFESIHPHDVEAIIEYAKKGTRWYQTNRGGV